MYAHTCPSIRRNPRSGWPTAAKRSQAVLMPSPSPSPSPGGKTPRTRPSVDRMMQPRTSLKAATLDASAEKSISMGVSYEASEGGPAVLRTGVCRARPSAGSLGQLRERGGRHHVDRGHLAGPELEGQRGLVEQDAEPPE